MGSWLAAFTTRGRCFLVAGAAAVIAGLSLGERDLLSIGILLLVLPLFAALAASRARYRLSCTRSIVPARIGAGQTAQVHLHLENVSRLPTGLLLAQDADPGRLGAQPRYVLNGIERGGSRDLSYPVRSELRGKFTIGPLQIQVTDAFGLVEFGRSFSSRTTLMVTPQVVPLPRGVVSGSWLGDGEGHSRAAAAAGEDDVVPRTYRDGDELRRVHWRSTARYGELMVRREEQQWRNRVTLLLDTRRSAHAGGGPASSFEFAVSAAASVGLHLAREGVDGELITDAGPAGNAGVFEDVLLNSLAVIKPSRGHELDHAVAAVRASGGLLAAILGRMTERSARQLAASRRGAGTSVALLLAVSSWSGGVRSPASPAPGAGSPDEAGSHNGGSQNGAAPARPADPADLAETRKAATILRAAGWRVAVLDAATPLAAAWQQLSLFPAAFAPESAGAPAPASAPGVPAGAPAPASAPGVPASAPGAVPASGGRPPASAPTPTAGAG